MLVLVVAVVVAKLLAAVLLIAHQGLQRAVAYEEGVVKRHLVVIDFLESLRRLQHAVVAFARDQAGLEVVGRELQVAVAPGLIGAQHAGERLLVELRARHAAVAAVLHLVGILLAPTPVPHHAATVAGEVGRVVVEVLVRLVLAAHGGLHLALGHDGVLVHHQHAGHGVAAVEQRGGAFQNLDRVDGLGVNLYAVLVAPLLALLADAVVDHDDAVVAQASDDGLRDAAARGELAHAGLMGHGVDDVGRGRFLQLAGSDHAHGRGRTGNERAARQAAHHHLAQHGVVLVQLEVLLACGAQVNGFDNGLMAHVAHLNGGARGGNVGQQILALGVADGALLQLWQVDAGAHDGLAAGGVGHSPLQRGRIGQWGGCQCHAHAQQ